MALLGQLYLYIYIYVWFPKCLPTVSGPSIVPCHNMGQSHHHLRLPIDLAQGHIWGTRGKIARTPFWWLLKGVDPTSIGKVWTPWTFGWTIGWETISGEIYLDHSGATSGTAVAVTQVAEPGGSCYLARKAWLLARVMRNPLACGVSYQVLTRAQMTCGSSCRRPVSYMECFQGKRRRT